LFSASFEYFVFLVALQQNHKHITLPHTNCISGGNAVESAYTQLMQNLFV